MFPDNPIYIESTNLISTFDNESLKKVTLKYTTKHQCSASKTVCHIFILTVHQLIMMPLLITLEIPHMNYIYHQLTISGNIMQKKMGGII